MLFLLALDQLENEDRRQIESLYHKYSSRVKKLSENIIKDTNYTDDIVNDTFVKVIKYKEKFTGVSEEERIRLLIIVTKSVCFNYLKKRKKLRFKELDVDDISSDSNARYEESFTGSEVLKTLLSEESAAFLKDAINNLSVPARDMIILKFYYEMKNVEIAEFYGMSASTVGTIIHRSIVRLRKQLGGYFDDTAK